MTANDPGRELDECWALTATNSGEEGVIGLLIGTLETPAISFDETRRRQFRDAVEADVLALQFRERHYISTEVIDAHVVVVGRRMTNLKEQLERADVSDDVKFAFDQVLAALQTLEERVK